MDRRDFLRSSTALAAGAAVAGSPLAALAASPHPRVAASLYEISLAQWSLHRTLRAGELAPLDFPRLARERYGLAGVEYVNQFFKDKARDLAWLRDLKDRCAGEGVTSVLIMCDGEGALGDPDEAARLQAVENHQKWVEAARFLGCHSIRVNAQSRGTWEEQQRLAADGLRRLSEFADGHDIDVIVENHGGLSSNGDWLAGTIRMVDHPRAGTLPDFGNFLVRREPEEWYDRYEGVAELMPYAKAVSAKSHDFDERGEETGTDYTRMMRIVLDAGYRGWVGIEYEGDRLSEDEGIHATKRLLERVRERLAADYAA